MNGSATTGHRSFDTEVAPHLRGHLQSRCRGDPVDHRTRKPGVFGHPLGEPGIAAFGIGEHGAPGDLTIVLDVVARHDRRCGDTAVATPGERLGDQRERGPVGIAVSALGDGQRNDPGGWRGQHLQRRLRIVGRVTVVDDRADHLCVPGAVGVLQDQRVEPVLIVQDVAHGPVGGHHPHPADAPLMRQAMLQQQVDVRGLMRPVEVTGPDVRDTDADAAAVICSARRSAGFVSAALFRSIAFRHDCTTPSGSRPESSLRE